MSSSLPALPSRRVRLGIRDDEADERYVDIRVAYRSLLLLLWAFAGFVVVASILATWTVLAGRAVQEARLEKKKKKNLDDDDDDDKVKRTHWRGWLLLRTMVLVTTWGVTTTYGAFYSFYLPFLYVNDRWYPLLTTQLFLWCTDLTTWAVLTWRVAVGICCGRRTGWRKRRRRRQLQQQCGSIEDDENDNNDFVGRICTGIKMFHLVFNLVVESNWRVARQWLFLVEDASYLALFHAVLPTLLQQMSVSGSLCCVDDYDDASDDDKYSCTTTYYDGGDSNREAVDLDDDKQRCCSGSEGDEVGVDVESEAPIDATTTTTTTSSKNSNKTSGALFAAFAFGTKNRGGPFSPSSSASPYRWGAASSSSASLIKSPLPRLLNRTSIATAVACGIVLAALVRVPFFSAAAAGQIRIT